MPETPEKKSQISTPVVLKSSCFLCGFTPRNGGSYLYKIRRWKVVKHGVSLIVDYICGICYKNLLIKNKKVLEKNIIKQAA